ncbi:TRAP transporter substrate-binding protein [Agrococcus beijingensis]|uniref:TRAP transporter substrate-binding protein n=1 Tax=Agrococcus beijingensis TaxID=3068634 RepID=UPI0027409565|nr:TRAP transporter substrate-binding protein [Agrococcus sp. REN33]
MRTTKTLGIAAAVGAAALMLTACSGGTAPASSGEPAAAGGGTLQLALNQTEEHPSYIALTSFGERLSEATDGRWSIDVFANETLGAQQETIQLVQDGTIDLSIVSGTQLENLNPDFGVLNLPTAFTTIESQLDVVHDDEIVGDLFASLEESNNISVVGGLTQGTRSVYTSFGPIETPADMAGKKLRVQESELHIAMAEALGGAATPMAFGELYTALQSGVVDAAENNAISYVTQRHFEVAPFWSNTNHLVGIDYMIADSAMLDGMSEEDRAAFDAEWDATYQEHADLWVTQTEEAIATAEAGGATFTDVDTAAFDEAIAPLIERFIQTDEQQALWDAVRAAQADA